MRRSDMLLRILTVVFVLVMIVSIAIPQDIRDNYEIIFLGIVLPIMGWLWIQMYVNYTKGN